MRRWGDSGRARGARAARFHDAGRGWRCPRCSGSPMPLGADERHAEAEQRPSREPARARTLLFAAGTAGQKWVLGSEGWPAATETSRERRRGLRSHESRPSAITLCTRLSGVSPPSTGPFETAPDGRAASCEEGAEKDRRVGRRGRGDSGGARRATDKSLRPSCPPRTQTGDARRLRFRSHLRDGARGGRRGSRSSRSRGNCSGTRSRRLRRSIRPR